MRASFPDMSYPAKHSPVFAMSLPRELPPQQKEQRVSERFQIVTRTEVYVEREISVVLLMAKR